MIVKFLFAALLVTIASVVSSANLFASVPLFDCVGAPAAYVEQFDDRDGVTDGKVSYPEPRIWTENQSWLEPQTFDPGSPNQGKQGHIHVNTCWPYYQSLSGPSLTLDVNIKLHNVAGAVTDIIGGPYFEKVNWVPGALWADSSGKWSCPIADCEKSFTWDMGLSANYTGVHQFYIYPRVRNEDRTLVWYNVNRWYAVLDNGMPVAPAGSGVHNTQISAWANMLGGDTWAQVPGQGNYAGVGMPRVDVPWDETTGLLKPVSGTWTPTVKFDAYRERFVTIDPSFHTNPPNLGMVVLNETNIVGGWQTRTLSIDTTQLSNGVHYLFMRATSIGTDGTRNAGVGVIPFLVENGGCQ